MTSFLFNFKVSNEIRKHKPNTRKVHSKENVHSVYVLLCHRFGYWHRDVFYLWRDLLEHPSTWRTLFPIGCDNYSRRDCTGVLARVTSSRDDHEILLQEHRRAPRRQSVQSRKLLLWYIFYTSSFDQVHIGLRPHLAESQGFPRSMW